MFERLLRRLFAVLLWVGALALGLFGVVFSFANYPWFAIAVLLLVLLLIGYADRRRRTHRKARERARQRRREQALS